MKISAKNKEEFAKIEKAVNALHSQIREQILIAEWKESWCEIQFHNAMFASEIVNIAIPKDAEQIDQIIEKEFISISIHSPGYKFSCAINSKHTKSISYLLL